MNKVGIENAASTAIVLTLAANEKLAHETETTPAKRERGGSKKNVCSEVRFEQMYETKLFGKLSGVQCQAVHPGVFWLANGYIPGT